MAVATFNAVIWEWQRDDGGYAPYHPEVSHAIEEARKNGKNTLHLGTLSKELSPYQLDVKNCTQTRSNTGMVRSIRRSPIQISGTQCNAVWEWQDGSLHHNLYSINAMIEIEEAYSLKQPSVDLSQQPSQLPYTIDFNRMYQIRHYYNTQRKIRRTALSKPLQYYLATESLGCSASPLVSGPPAIASLGTVTTFPLHGTPLGTPFNSLTPNIYTVSMPSVYPHPSGITTTFGITSQFGLTSTGTHSAPAGPTATVASSTTGVTTSHGKGRKGTSKTTTASKAKESKSKPPSKATGRTAKSPAKRYKAKVEKPAANNKVFSPEMPYLRKVSQLKKEDDGPCPICMSELSEMSGFTEGSTDDDSGLYKLTKCGHIMHTPCVAAYVENSNFSKGNFQCPTCKKIYGVKTGDMPPGRMTVSHVSSSLPGHDGHGTIQIVYDFHSKVHNGKRYLTNGFPRTCYLPDSPRGQKVLKLLRKAWDRKLTFTIGTSVTTGATDTLVWNEIHHKTESTSNHSGHGYPDPNYLDNVLMELSIQGVEDSADEGDTASGEETSSDSDL